MGFLLIEIMVIQRLTLLLGNPLYAAAVTLGALLVFSGVGSELSDRVPSGRAPVACAVVAALSLFLALIWTRTAVLSEAPLVLRAGAAGVGVGGLGVAMGFPFPLGLRSFRGREGGVALAWGVNGVASVLGSSLAIILAMEIGGRMVLMVGALCDLGAAAAAWSHGRRGLL